MTDGMRHLPCGQAVTGNLTATTLISHGDLL